MRIISYHHLEAHASEELLVLLDILPRGNQCAIGCLQEEETGQSTNHYFLQVDADDTLSPLYPESLVYHGCVTSE